MERTDSIASDRDASPGTAKPIDRARPRHVFIHVSNTDMWKALTRVIGQPELADVPLFAERSSRVPMRRVRLQYDSVPPHLATEVSP